MVFTQWPAIRKFRVKRTAVQADSDIFTISLRVMDSASSPPDMANPPPKKQQQQRMPCFTRIRTSAMSEWADDALHEELETHQGNELKHNSSQLAEPLWTDPGLKSRSSVR